MEPATQTQQSLVSDSVGSDRTAPDSGNRSYADRSVRNMSYAEGVDARAPANQPSYDEVITSYAPVELPVGESMMDRLRAKDAENSPLTATAARSDDVTDDGAKSDGPDSAKSDVEAPVPAFEASVIRRVPRSQIIDLDGQIVELIVLQSETNKHIIRVGGDEVVVTEDVFERVRRKVTSLNGLKVESVTTDNSEPGVGVVTTDATEAVFSDDHTGVSATGGEQRTETGADGGTTTTNQGTTRGLLFDKNGQINLSQLRSESRNTEDASGNVVATESTAAGYSGSVGPGGAVNVKGTFDARQQTGQKLSGLKADATVGTEGVGASAEVMRGIKKGPVAMEFGLGGNAHYSVTFSFKPGKPKGKWSISAVTTIGVGLGATLSAGDAAKVKASLEAKAQVSSTYKETETLSEAQMLALYGKATKLKGKPAARGDTKLKAMASNADSIGRAVEAILSHGRNIGSTESMKDHGDGDSVELVTNGSVSLGANVSAQVGGVGLNAGGSVGESWVRGIKATKRKPAIGDAGVRKVDGKWARYSLTAEDLGRGWMTQLEVQFQDVEMWQAQGGFSFGAAKFSVSGGQTSTSGLAYHFLLFGGDVSAESVRSAVTATSSPEALERVGRRQEPAALHLQKYVTTEGTTEAEGAVASVGGVSFGAGQDVSVNSETTYDGAGRIVGEKATGTNKAKVNVGLTPVFGLNSETTFQADADATATGVTVATTFGTVSTTSWFGGWASSKDESLRKAVINERQFKVVCMRAREPQKWSEACAFSPDVWRHGWKALGQTLARTPKDDIEAILGEADGYSSNEAPWSDYPDELKEKLRCTAKNVVRARAVAEYVGNGAYSPHAARAVLFKLTDSMGENLTDEYTVGGKSGSASALSIRQRSFFGQETASKADQAKGAEIAKTAGLPAPEDWVYDSDAAAPDYMFGDVVDDLSGSRIDLALAKYRLAIGGHSDIISPVVGNIGRLDDPETAWNTCRAMLPSGLQAALASSRGERAPADEISPHQAVRGWGAVVWALRDYVDNSTYQVRQFRVMAEMAEEVLKWETLVAETRARLGTRADIEPRLDVTNLGEQVDAYQQMSKKLRIEHEGVLRAVRKEGSSKKGRQLWNDLYRTKPQHQKVIFKYRELMVSYRHAGTGFAKRSVNSYDDAVAVSRSYEWDYAEMRDIAYDVFRAVSDTGNYDPW